MGEFYYPKTKRELLKFVEQRYPKDLKRFKQMDVSQLRAIWLGIIKNYRIMH